MSHGPERAWLILLPQIPPQPSSLRVRVWRRLQQIGAVAVKNAAYVLPDGETAREDFTWLRQEIVDAGGGALLLEATALDGAEGEIRQLFVDERERDYRKLIEETRLVTEPLREEKNLPADLLHRGERQIRQLRERLERIREIDFFSAPAAAEASAALRETEMALRRRTGVLEEAGVPAPARGGWSDRLWVTRAGVYVDRLACAWIVSRFLDPQARFAFLRSGEPVPEEGIPFDMAGVELGHHGTRCTAETFAARFFPDDAALQAVAEVVHDLDLKDEGFGRPEAAGLKRLLDGVCSGAHDDFERVRRALPLFDALYAGFQQ